MIEHFHAGRHGKAGLRHSHEDGDLAHLHEKGEASGLAPNVRLRAVEYPGSDDPGASMMRRVSRAHPSFGVQA